MEGYEGERREVRRGWKSMRGRRGWREEREGEERRGRSRRGKERGRRG